MPKPKLRYCVAQVWMNGVKTVEIIERKEVAIERAQIYANMYKGNLVYLGTLVEQSSEPMEDDYETP